MRRESLKLSEHWKGKTFCGYKKFIWGRMFYFGVYTDRQTAEDTAKRLIGKAKQLQEAGATKWTNEAVAEVMPVQPKVVFACTASTRDESAFSLYDGIRLYLDHLKTKVPHQLSEANYARQIRSLDYLKSFFDDRPLDGIGFEDLSKMVGTFTARPKSKITGKPISVETVTTTVKAVRNLFDHLADCGRWEECRRYHRVWKIRPQKLLTDAERIAAEDDIQTFSVKELVTLYGEATEQQRLYLLLGLNTAATNYDLATLLKRHVIDGGKAIRRHRSKTKVLMQYDLWLETQALLKKFTAPDNAAGLALLTKDGKPLVRFEGERRIDSVRSLWLKLTTRCEGRVRPLPFKFLRKTGAQMVCDVAGVRASQLHLSHGKKTLAEKRYVNAKKFTKLSQSLSQVYHLLKQAGMFDQPLVVRAQGRAAHKAKVVKTQTLKKAA